MGTCNFNTITIKSLRLARHHYIYAPPNVRFYFGPFVVERSIKKIVNSAEKIVQLKNMIRRIVGKRNVFVGQTSSSNRLGEIGTVSRDPSEKELRALAVHSDRVQRSNMPDGGTNAFIALKATRLDVRTYAREYRAPQVRPEYARPALTDTSLAHRASDQTEPSYVSRTRTIWSS